jgi:hypothetical protein
VAIWPVAAAHISAIADGHWREQDSHYPPRRGTHIGHRDPSNQGDPVYRASRGVTVEGSDIQLCLPDEQPYSLLGLLSHVVLTGDTAEHSGSLYEYTAAKVADELDKQSRAGDPAKVRDYDGDKGTFVIGTKIGASGWTSSS